MPEGFLRTPHFTNSPPAVELLTTSTMSSSLLSTFVEAISATIIGVPPPVPPVTGKTLNLDVLEVILDFVQGDGPFDYCHPNRQTVLALALTHKAYTYTCLARLWKNIPDLQVLNQLFETEHGKMWFEEIVYGSRVSYSSQSIFC